MDLLDFSGEPMYFDEPVSPQVEQLLAEAAHDYGEPDAECALLRAYFLEPQHLTVLVALYRYFYYQHRYADALLTAERAITVAAQRLKLPLDWRTLTEADLNAAAQVSMPLTRFVLFALKGASYLLLRLGDAPAALERLDRLVALDTHDRLGVLELQQVAHAATAHSTGDDPHDDD
ncbi:hypothetical protein SAMN05421644_10335 [Allochromatium warmingii]|uniref:Tetratricopeptide repeat-containing protein n=1 Tax=Allochromatium warmingii TaxID=61595 RepID=A0A1H3BID6_ALLWA|nr:hypothetical protein [Allochromatium warmingii]SDX41488.1 hypothetical protein SAMN05421644_10335 [Allochromatium warmingii]